jgi:hypothetical protein
MTTLQSAPPAKADTSKARGDGHFYAHTAERGWYPLYADGGTFGLKAARELKATGVVVVPSVTGYIAEKRKHQIEDYGKKQAALAARDIPMASFANEDDWLDAVLAKADGASRPAIDLGSRIHKAVENCIGGESWDADLAVYVDATMKEIAVAGMNNVVSEECVGSLKYGAAGKLDLSDEPTMTIGDIKTRGHKINKVKVSRVPYYETDLMQVAAYGYFRFGNDFFNKGRGIVFGVSTVVPGLVTPHTFAGRDLVEAFSTFLALTQVWRFSHDFEPRVTA